MAGERISNAQARGKRQQDVRGTNAVEASPLGAAIVNSLYAVDGSIPVPSSESEDYGEPLLVLGYERITLLAAVVSGTASGFFVSVQVASHTSEWHNLLVEDKAVAGQHAPLILTILSDDNWALTIPTSGAYMRFGVWSNGGDAATRLTLSAVRHMDAS